MVGDETVAAAAAAVPTPAIDGSASPKELASAALDRWIFDLNDDAADLKEKLRDAKQQLQSS
jgi:hypothetical protein